MPRFLVVGLAAAVLGLFVVVELARAHAGQAATGRNQLRTLFHGGRRRTYLVHVGAAADPARRRPLIFVLHGGGGDGSRVATLTGFSRLADTAGFIVVYPDGVNRHWNDGRNVHRYRAQREKVDDVGFIRSLINRLERDQNVDPARVYATGISNGGMMCHRLGCELADRIAAIAPVAAAMPASLADSCRPSRPVSVLAINGTDDPLVPFGGGGVGALKKRGAVRSVGQTIESWVEADGCNPVAETTELPDRDPDDGIKVQRAVYAGGQEGSEVILYTVDGGGHTWPGGAPRTRRFGRTARDFDATETIWQFFERHTRK